MVLRLGIVYHTHLSDHRATKVIKVFRELKATKVIKDVYKRQGYANANAVVYTTGGVPFSLEGLVPSEATTKHVSIRSANAAGLSQASYGYVPNAAISSGAVQIFVSGSEVTGNITADVIVFEAFIAKV